MNAKPRHRTEVSISIAEDAGRLVHIGELAHLKGTSTPRPVFECPGCGDPVRPRIGHQRRGHFAHAARNDCWALTEEGKRHLLAKHHLARELQLLDAAGRAALGLTAQCGEDGSRFRAPPDLFRCMKTHTDTFGDWRTVEVEKRADLTTRRPDINLTDLEGNTILALEIVHTNAIDEAKAAELFSFGIPWVEIDVSGAGFDEVMTWTHQNPELPCTRGSVDFAWRCADHGSSEAPLHFRVVDNYFPQGEPWEDRGFRRDIYWVVRRWDQGEVAENQLWRKRGPLALERLGHSAPGGDSVGTLFTRAMDTVTANEPDATVRDRDRTWMSLEHLPVAERLPYVLRAADPNGEFPKRRAWSEKSRSFVWPVPSGPSIAVDLKAAAQALHYRLLGYTKPWKERPRDPYEVPVIPAGLRAAWFADEFWEVLQAHMSGEKLVPGVDPFTKKELWARLLGREPRPPGGVR